MIRNNTLTATYIVTPVFFSLLLSGIPAVKAQLVDATQTTPVISGSQIGKSLEEQIGAGQGDEFTPGSSIYLIKRDPARAIRRGRQLFQRKFTLGQGHGPRVSNDSSGDIQDSPGLGAGLGDSCATCHGRPRGSAGFGGDVATRPDSRDAPHLFGLGLQEMLADEITQELRTIRTEALDTASESGAATTSPLISKGIDYGVITAEPDGSLETSWVTGVDGDLRVRPFFAQGKTLAMREFIVGAFKDEMGMEAPDPILCTATDPSNPQTVTSPAGMVFDPELDDIARPPVCSSDDDGDGDNVINEVDPALVDHMEFYLLNYFKPAIADQDESDLHGLSLMESIGCTTCHVPDLTIDRDRRVADVETRHDAENGIFNQLFATVTELFDTVADGDVNPLLLPQEASFEVENIFTDFKRHDLGPAFHERNYDGSLQTEFMTEPLWGVGSTGPYGHDGRSINLEQVILRHGGEAQESRDIFAALDREERRQITEFLSTLVLFPPDDTASSLNPGNPATDNPQDPAEHGSINLGELFQIESEGIE